MNMPEQTLESHREVLRLIERDLKFIVRNAAEFQDDDDDRISKCCNLN
jgi:hypothetical protein